MDVYNLINKYVCDIVWDVLFMFKVVVVQGEICMFDKMVLVCVWCCFGIVALYFLASLRNISVLVSGCVGSCSRFVLNFCWNYILVFFSCLCVSIFVL